MIWSFPENDKNLCNKKETETIIIKRTLILAGGSYSTSKHLRNIEKSTHSIRSIFFKEKGEYNTPLDEKFQNLRVWKIRFNLQNLIETVN